MTKEDVIKEFTKIKGINKDTAEILYKNGFNSVAKLKKASSKDLSKIEGINQDILKNIKGEQKEKTTVKADKKTKKPLEKAEKKIEEKQKAGKKEKIEAKPETKEKQKTEKKEEPEEEKEKYIVKKKPKLSKEQIETLRIRKQIKDRTPEFLREECRRYKRIPMTWRKPDGISSKLRKNLKYRPMMVRIGFRGPKETRYLHPSGFREVVVNNINDLNKIDSKTQAARIGSTVGTKKRIDIEKKAEELDIRILNM